MKNRTLCEAYIHAAQHASTLIRDNRSAATFCKVSSATDERIDHAPYPLGKTIPTVPMSEGNGKVPTLFLPSIPRFSGNVCLCSRGSQSMLSCTSPVTISYRPSP